MLIATIILATLLVATVILLALEDRKSDRLLAEKAVLQKQADDLRDVITAVHKDDEAREKAEESDEPSVDCQKPLTVESIRTALRFNGYSPEIPDTREQGEVLFKQDETLMRVQFVHPPFVAISAGFAVDEAGTPLSLLQKAAEDVTAHLFIGKAYLVDEGKGVVFSAEFFCDTYAEFRDRLKDYIRVVMDSGRHFYEAVDRLKGEAKKEQEAVFSGESFIRGIQANNKKIQS